IDNTLPGFELSTLGEAYLQFKTKIVYAKLGNQVINTPWANSSDSRIKPVAFQGIDTNVQFNPNFSVGLTRMTQFEGRTSSSFDKSTLLTSRPAGNPPYPIYSTNGFFLANATYKTKQVSLSANDYSFLDIGNLLYLEAKGQLAQSSPLKPFVALQYVSERQSGRALVGIINSSTFGGQLGASLGKNIDVAASFDTSPWQTANITAGSCAAAGTGYFLPVGGTPNCQNLGASVYRI
nr:OprD family porin [Candidatus Eremiobacteraeota bacterium]